MRLDDIDELDEVTTWAKYMKVSRDTGYDLCASGIWPSFKFGKNVRIRKSVMLQRIEDMERNPELAEQLSEKYSAYWQSKSDKVRSLA
jgi:excisionase family DNA binding protein